MLKSLIGMNPAELREVTDSFGLPGFTAGQIARWIYQKKVTSIDGMTNLSKAARSMLSAEYEVGRVPFSEVVSSCDGTRKYLFPVKGSLHSIEAVMIPDGERKTLCVSSQAGCRMNCSFCMTGRGGFHGNLDASQIISQFLSVEESDQLTNTVFMGMGEPLDNFDNVMRCIEILTSDWGFGWSPKRITLSTIGVLPNLRRFLNESRCHLAVSLHNPFGDERLGMMPVQKAYPIEDVIRLIRQYDFSGQRRVSFEYTMFAGVNDSDRHCNALAALLGNLECRVNLIRFHRIPDSPLHPSSDDVMERFRDRLSRSGITTTIRASRGEDIFAACGMLAGKDK